MAVDELNLFETADLDGNGELTRDEFQETWDAFTQTVAAQKSLDAEHTLLLHSARRRRRDAPPPPHHGPRTAAGSMRRAD